MADISEKIRHLSPAQLAQLKSRLRERNREKPSGKSLDFTLLFFSSDGSGRHPDKYALLLDCARFADRNGFAGIWTPERHFQNFGGLYPNPSVLGAAIAVVTERIQIRAGSCVLPLHNPIRVAEEWSVVDNLSNGRVAIGFASGWHAQDFAMAPEAYDRRREIMDERLDLVRRLWSGETVTVPGTGGPMALQIYPRPIQDTLPIWLTGGSEQTWAKAARLGANVLCLLGPSVADLAERIRLYRQARMECGMDPAGGKVTVTLHTYLDTDLETAKRKVRGPLRNYLEGYIEQFRPLLDASVVRDLEGRKDDLLDFAFERYFQQSSLLGTPEKCHALLNRLAEAGVDEIACLVDFGLPHDDVMSGLGLLDQVRLQYARTIPPAPPSGAAP